MFDFQENENSEIKEKYKENIEQIESLVNNYKDEILKEIGNFEDFENKEELEKILQNGFKVSVGDKVLKFDLTGSEKTPTDEISDKVKEKYQQKLQDLKEYIDEKIHSLQESYETKVEKLEDEYEKVREENSKFIMPDVGVEEAKRGLSVVKGESPNELIWLYRDVYKVETIDGKPIDPSVSKLTETPAIIQITTNENKVTNIKLKYWGKLDNFSHYHSIDSGSSDCWGDWNYLVNWESPEDIIDIGEHAFGILKDVNSASPGDTEPPFLPRLDELKHSIVENVENTEEYNSDYTNRLQGRDDSQYIWNINEMQWGKK